MKLSPNSAEGKDRPSLKDLGSLIKERETQQSTRTNAEHNNTLAGGELSNITSTPIATQTTRQNAPEAPRNSQPQSGLDNHQKAHKEPKNSPRSENRKQNSRKTPSKSPNGQNQAREIAKRAEAKFAGKVANPKLKSTGKVALSAAGPAQQPAERYEDTYQNGTDFTVQH